MIRKIIERADKAKKQYEKNLRNYLRGQGWKESCMHPGNLWLWSKDQYTCDLMTAVAEHGSAQGLGRKQRVVDDADSHSSGSPIRSVTACNKVSSWKLPFVR